MTGNVQLYLTGRPVARTRGACRMKGRLGGFGVRVKVWLIGNCFAKFEMECFKCYADRVIVYPNRH